MSDSKDPREVELKLRIPPDSLPRLMRHRLLRGTPDKGALNRRLVSTYFDTPDFQLMRARVALRVRKDGSRRIQTVKCAPTAEDGARSRREWEREVGTDRPMLKGVGNKPLRKLLNGGKVEGRLAPQFVTDFRRSTYPIKLRDSTVELAVDVGQITSANGGSKGKVSICEAELELKSGNIAGMYALAQELHKSLGCTIEPLSKAERGFALVAQMPPKPQRAQSLKLAKHGTLAEAFVLIGRNGFVHLRSNEGAVRSHATVEGLHQFRVALRRLRSALTAFRDVLPAAERRRFGRDMRWIAQRFGHAREWDVFQRDILTPVRKQIGDDPALAALAGASKAARAEAYRVVSETVVSPRFTETLLRLEGWWEGGAAVEALGDNRDVDVRDHARQTLKRLHRRVRKLGERSAELDEMKLHELRIRTKKLRYAAEFFASLFPRKAVKEYLGALTGIQDRLGSLNDAAMVKHLLGEIEKRNGMDKGALARANGIVTGWNAARVAADLKRLPDAWGRFAELRPFWK